MHPILHRLMLYPLIIIAVLYVFLIFLALRSDGILYQPHPSGYRDSDFPSHSVIKLRSGSDTITAVYFPYVMPDPPLDAGGDEHSSMRTPNSPPKKKQHDGRWDNGYVPPTGFTLLMSHGNAEDIGDNRDLYREYAARGYAIFAYDYQGYGTSTGTPSERNANLDERAAWDYLVNTLHIPPSRIILHGTSVGCGPAVELAAQLSSLLVDQRPAALILQSPFRSAFTVLTRVPLLPWDKFNNARRIREVRMPVLVIHGTADQVIPFSHGQAVFHNASPIGDSDAPLTRDSGKQHLWLPNAGHNDIFIVNSATYFQKIESFTAQLPH
jgi:alpha-beta hydrolase superfamily lysophospholipase